MAAFRYIHLDVFTDRPFAGNALAVFPDARGLSVASMQQIANELAFSETAFVLPPESSGNDARVRIFTPKTELPMAGHPTIGTAYALAQEGRCAAGQPRMVLELGIGPTPVDIEWAADRPRFVWMGQPIARIGREIAESRPLATALGLEHTDILAGALSPQVASSGVPFLFVPLGTRAAVDRIVIDRTALAAFFRAEHLEELPVFAFSLDSASEACTAYSRMFAPVLGIPEDAATGGASGPLGAYLLHRGAVTPEQAGRLISLQGVKMGRPSTIHIRVRGSFDHITEVSVGGQAVVVGEGTIRT